MGEPIECVGKSLLAERSECQGSANFDAGLGLYVCAVHRAVIAHPGKKSHEHQSLPQITLQTLEKKPKEDP